jgi:hypothetical protein
MRRKPAARRGAKQKTDGEGRRRELTPRRQGAKTRSQDGQDDAGVFLTLAGGRRLAGGTICAMPNDHETTELLFSYGTLQLEAVQRATFGRKLTGTADALPGFAREMMKIEDAAVVATSGQTHHPIVSFTGRAEDAVDGMVFAVTHEELRNADTYEVAAYKRVAVTLRSGKPAWVYVDARFRPPDE